jgi:hypothetical protein
MDLQRQTEVLEGSLGRQLAWIAAADGKTGFIFAVATAMLGLLASAAPKYGDWTALGVAFAVTATATLVSCLACVVATIFPRTTGPKLSVIFFGAVADRSVDDYRAEVQSLTDEAYTEDLIQQCHINAQIAAVKFTWVKRASVLLAVSVIPWVVAAYFLFRDK